MWQKLGLGETSMYHRSGLPKTMQTLLMAKPGTSHIHQVNFSLSNETDPKVGGTLIQERQ
jgi:hypothetical protein